MKDYIKSRYAKFSMVFAAGVRGVGSLAGTAGATADPVLTDASEQVTDYFTDNLGIAVGAFIAVAGVLWILHLIFRSVGIHKKKSVG